MIGQSPDDLAAKKNCKLITLDGFRKSGLCLLTIEDSSDSRDTIQFGYWNVDFLDYGDGIMFACSGWNLTSAWLLAMTLQHEPCFTRSLVSFELNAPTLTIMFDGQVSSGTQHCGRAGRVGGQGSRPAHAGVRIRPILSELCRVHKCQSRKGWSNIYGVRHFFGPLCG